MRTTLRRRGIEVEDVCGLCSMPGESIEHLLLECVVARDCWTVAGLQNWTQDCGSKGEASLISFSVQLKLVRRIECKGICQSCGLCGRIRMRWCGTQRQSRLELLCALQPMNWPGGERPSRTGVSFRVQDPKYDRDGIHRQRASSNVTWTWQFTRKRTAPASAGWCVTILGV
ncbi:hypothetical protein LINPERPRIM_LOCUS22058 [Linum perenne]